MVDIHSEEYILGQNIRKYRLEKGWSQKQLSDAVDIDRADISKYENGTKGEMGFKTLKKFAAALEVSTDALLAEKKRPMVLEVELPEDALTRRRIGVYERHGLVFNSYPYLQPPMRKGQGVLPLRLMTKPAAIDAKTYQRYKKRIHSIVYKYEGDL